MIKIKIPFSFTRWLAVVMKELHELRRDKVSIGMVFLTPLLQLIILGYAVNMDPHRIPSALINYDSGQLSKVFISSVQNTDYFSFQSYPSAEEARNAFVRGNILFMVTIPEGFTRKILRGEKPQLLVQGDAIDPLAIGNALSALSQVAGSMFQYDLPESLRNLQQENTFELVIQRMFNPEGITRFNTIPGIIGSILSTTLILMTALAITRERESGAMENLLISPVTAPEVILGKITPYVLVGGFQSLMILWFAVYLFNIPVLGSFSLLFLVLVIYIFLCLCIGIMISSVAKNQLQALQLSSFYFIPSVMLSGFISPFISMPVWAQMVGSCLPLTYFIRLIKAVMLKGYTMAELLPELLSLAVIGGLVILISLHSYRKTLD
ncbi:mannose-1-phosphate guanyltransferase [Tatumella morbirosei]|uniref:Mannose-1-phosphate guanyltransferase n=1 Tax=Tatumella morbirosei TaxID=642227 RepID=A0A095TS72_9GAMM|nr:ABC transporter permease [Tatumella morbirosei]KGD79681.2 mannose-1-phosphate guanyltransferase [Tatumella morbirosei]